MWNICADILAYVAKVKVGKRADVQDAKLKLEKIDHEIDEIHDKAGGVEKDVSLLVTVWNMVNARRALRNPKLSAIVEDRN